MFPEIFNILVFQNKAAPLSNRHFYLHHYTGNIMKSIKRFTVGFIPVIVILCMGYTASDKMYYPEGVTAVYGHEDKMLNESPDTVPPLPKKLPEFKVPKPPANLLKMIGEIFKFRKHRNQREEVRVMNIINKLSINDSIKASEANVTLLINKLADTVNQNFDSLVSMISKIRRDDSLFYAERLYEMDSAMNSLNDGVNSLNRKITDFSKITTDQYGIPGASRASINKLADKIFPIINYKATVTDVEERMKKVRMFENIRDSVNMQRSFTDTSGKEHRFLVHVNNKLPVYGFYDAARGGLELNEQRFMYLNTLLCGPMLINSQNGTVKDLVDLDNNPVIPTAQRNGCSIGLNFLMDKEAGLADFLSTTKHMESFFTDAFQLLKERNCDAVNISFGLISPDLGYKFTEFIGTLSRKLRNRPDHIKLLVTIPATKLNNFYQIDSLVPFCDGIIADFSKNYSSNIAVPLASMKNITDVVGYFYGQRVTPEKMVVCLPYRGVKWAINTGLGDRYIETISYSTIRKNFPFPGYFPAYDTLSASPVMDSSVLGQKAVRRIYYDDESSLGEKYKFIVESKMGGVAVNALNDGGNYSGLWDELSYNFGTADTTFYDGPVTAEIKPAGPLSFFEELYRECALYNYILQNPCETCFENVKDSAKREWIYQYLADLRIGHKMDSVNRVLIRGKKDTYRSMFEFVNEMLNTRLMWLSVISFIIFAGLSLFYYFKTKYAGDVWKGKKLVGQSIAVAIILFIIIFFAYIFTAPHIDFFGSTVSSNSGYSKDYTKIHNEANTGISRIEDSNYCAPDPDSSCVNMSFHTLLLIILIGLLLGFLFTKFLLPQLRRNRNLNL